MNHLSQGHYIYGMNNFKPRMFNAKNYAGVNTGFGGSADSRTTRVVSLQAALMQLTQAGILSHGAPGKLPGQAMSISWIRATILVRCNATVRGHSAVSVPVLQAVINLLQHKLTPIVPLRGSISASGDLMPLSYIAGTIEGNPDIQVELDDGRIMPADEALQIAGIEPITLGPKEGLGLVNGTACSAAVGALVMNEAHRLALLTQALTSMAVEVSISALNGMPESTFLTDYRL
jgi:phenylalanine ammonia-lyase